jgi:WD40 repeat protein
VAAFSPNGAWVLTASWDKTAKLWNVGTPAELARQVKESLNNTARTRSSSSIAELSAEQVESLSAIASGLEFSKDGAAFAELKPMCQDFFYTEHGL